VTQVVGLIASDGAVIAADTEISDGELKGLDTKVLVGTLSGPVLKALALGGAGNLSYFEAMRLKLSEVVINEAGPTPDSDPFVERALDDFILEFYNRRILPFKNDECPPYVDTLVATWVKGYGSLWCTEQMTTRKCYDGRAVIGTGRTFPLDLLNAYYEPRCPVEAVAVLAAYTVWRSTHTLNGVGNVIQMIVLNDNGAFQVPSLLIGKLESNFREYHDSLGNMFKYMSGMQSESYYKNALSINKRLQMEFAGFHQFIKAMISETSHT
jgi:hypothetical protein